MARRSLTETEKQETIKAANTYNTMRQAAKSLNVPYKTFVERAKKLGVYKPNPHPSREGKQIGGTTPRLLEDIINGSYPSYPTSKLKQRLIDNNWLEHKCSKCDQPPYWNGEKLTLQLDHIDGNRWNHLFNNLRLLCPNCHSQTETYCSSNKGTKVSDQQLLESYNRQGTIAGALRECKLSISGTNYKRVRKLANL